MLYDTCRMKKIYQKLLLLYYRRMLRKYFFLYLRKGCSVSDSVIYATDIVAWRKAFDDIRSFSSLENYLQIADECQASAPPQMSN